MRKDCQYKKSDPSRLVDYVCVALPAGIKKYIRKREVENVRNALNEALYPVIRGY